jgi:uncharacterized coiled-coil DUF342 family protein
MRAAAARIAQRAAIGSRLSSRPGRQARHAGDNREEDSRVAEALDSVLKERLRAVLDGRSVTEAELRKLAEEGRACALIMRAQLERSERRLSELAADPASALTEMAAALRDVNDLRPELNELHALLAELQERAREFRAAWLAVP